MTIKNDNIAKQMAQVEASLPQFVLEDHPKFVKFMKLYFEWKGSIGSGAALNYMKINNDIDIVSDEMLGTYRNLISKDLPIDLKTEYRFFAKFLKQFYEIKGTEESYKIFFRAVFNADVSVDFPRKKLFIPSAATWNKDRHFIIKYEGDAFSLQGTVLRGKNHGYKCVVDRVVKIGSNYMVFPEKGFQPFEPNEILLTENDDNASVVPVYGIVSINSKSEWYDGDIINLTNGVSIKVDKIYYGDIRSLTITNGGEGYEIGDIITTKSNFSGTGFKAEVSAINGSGSITSVLIRRNGFGYINENVSFITDGNPTIEATFVPTWNDNFRKIQSASIIVNQENLNPSQQTIAFGNVESMVLKQGVYTDKNMWKVIRSAPSTPTATIHDSSYYQEYSYVLKSTVNVHAQEKALRTLLHVAGLAMFIERIVSDSIPSKVSTSLVIGQ